MAVIEMNASNPERKQKLALWKRPDCHEMLRRSQAMSETKFTAVSLAVKLWHNDLGRPTLLRRAESANDENADKGR